jgi:ABC-type siderophore export system fused ATPase/permease subunit
VIFSCTVGTKTSQSTLLISLTILATILIIISLALTICVIQRMCMAKKTSEEDRNQQPTYEDIIQSHKEIPMEENTAYGQSHKEIPTEENAAYGHI